MRKTEAPADVAPTIRNASLSDAPALASLMCELGYETTTAEMRQRLKSILSDAGFRTFVAEINGQVCGVIGTLAHPSHEHNDFSGKIIASVVSKKQRRRGIGCALIAEAEKDFAERAVARVSLTTRFTRKEAHQSMRRSVIRGQGSASGKSPARLCTLIAR